MDNFGRDLLIGLGIIAAGAAVVAGVIGFVLGKVL